MKYLVGFLLAVDKFMPEMHFRQPRFTYSACGPFTIAKREHKIQKKRRFSMYLSNKTWFMEILNI